MRASSFDAPVGRDGDPGHIHAVNVTLAVDLAIEDSTGLVIDHQLEKNPTFRSSTIRRTFESKGTSAATI
jgi:hypothetical protein